MIVAETEGGYRLLTQPAHASLAGRFADHWGTDAFSPPDPSPAVAIAAHVHDDGWFTRDRRPRLGEDGTPESFTEVDPEAWIALYDRGIEAAIELESYAGLLVAMHGTGLRRRRYGLSPTWPATPAAYAAFVDRQERRQRSLAARLREAPDGVITDEDVALLESLHETGEPPNGLESRLWRNYALLQAWDALSLALCETTTPPAYGEVGHVPTGSPANSSETVSFELEALEDGAVGVDPYPFDVEPLEVTVPTRTVDASGVDDEASLRRRYYTSPLVDETIRLRRSRR